MKRPLLITLVTVGVLAFAIIASYFSFSNTADKLESGARAQFKANKTSYDTMWKTVQEVAQVPKQYKNDFKDILVSESEAKFGEGGSKAMMQWFQERDIRLDPAMYIKVQTVIEAGRKDFQRGQDMLADRQRRYEDHLRIKPGAYWKGMSGHPMEVRGKFAPTEDLDGDGFLTVLDYPIVTSAKTEAVFASGEENEVANVFGN